MKKEFTNSTRYWSIRQTYGNWCDHFCMHTPSKYSKSWKILRLLKTVRPRSHILTLFRLVCVNVYAFCVLSSIRWIEILVNKNAVVANVNAHATNTENMKQCKHFCADWCLFLAYFNLKFCLMTITGPERLDVQTHHQIRCCCVSFVVFELCFFHLSQLYVMNTYTYTAVVWVR